MKTPLIVRISISTVFLGPKNRTIRGPPVHCFADLSDSGALESHRLSKLSTNQNVALPGCTVHFDWLKFGAQVLFK